ncbi:MAG: replicative DNA helicase [Bacilli bacterium]|nr:replicative DNA helicase [Bacilli bacterium]
MAEMIKSLPHNTEAEKAVLGAMIRSASKLSDGMGALVEEDFFEENKNHRAIFSAMARLYKRSVPVDTQTLVDELINSKELEVSGGVQYLIELVDSVVTFANFNHYVRIIQDQAVLCRFLKSIARIENDYHKKDIGNVSDFLAQSEKELREIAELRKVGDFMDAKKVSSILSQEFEQLKEATTDDTVTGTPTGFRKLNQLTHGFQKGEFIVLAARPGVGKTALALNLAYNAASRGNRPVGYFSLEMPATTLFKRLVSNESHVRFDSLLTGYNLSKNNARLKIMQACESLSKMKFYVDDTSGIQLLDLVAKVRTLYNREPDLGLVVVDYIGLVNTNLRNKADRHLEVQLVSQTLKKLALELKIPIIGVAQLNRKVEDRPGGEPQLSDLRESGSIEQDADIVMLLHEPKIVQDEDQGKKKSIFDESAQKVDAMQDKVAKKEGGPSTTIVNVIIAKNRSGKQGKVPLLFSKDYCRFDSPSTESENEIAALESERVSYFNRD